MKEEQDKLEKQLWEEREDIRKSHEEKVKVAKTKCVSRPLLPSPFQPFYRAKMIGVGLSKHDAEVIDLALQLPFRHGSCAR
jgi:hypothetical protein